jgi:hypothetical protein
LVEDEYMGRRPPMIRRSEATHLERIEWAEGDIAELQDQNTALRAALDEMARGYRVLIRHMARVDPNFPADFTRESVALEVTTPARRVRRVQAPANASHGKTRVSGEI